MARPPQKNPKPPRRAPVYGPRNLPKSKRSKPAVPPRARRRTMPRLLGRFTLDPSRSQHHARDAHRVMPYTVIREKVALPFTVNPTKGVTLIFGAFGAVGALNPIAGIFGLDGTGAGAPSAVPSRLLTTATVGRARVHRLAVTLSCTGTNSPTTAPDGIVYMGTLRTPIDYSNSLFTTFADVAALLTSREEVHACSALSLQYHPKRQVSHPLDTVSYDSFNTISASIPVTPPLQDGMAPIVVYIPRGVNVNSFILTVHVEWTIEYTADAVLQATARTHPTMPTSVWQQLTDGAISAGGVVSAAAGAAEGLMSLGGAAQRGYQGLARGLPRLFG